MITPQKPSPSSTFRSVSTGHSAGARTPFRYRAVSASYGSGSPPTAPLSFPRSPRVSPAAAFSRCRAAILRWVSVTGAV
jgi:hypothetical protein